eukprot:TRINITY_DN5894_c0_g1_i1.p1 TRINITY_DN5894_c0_g1~~TRINITY_DN5894_c0_g1_i1.p1  ORF type:complete len:317 (-),score=34.00 TRINITY_DN5894_c0_g1_i1:267-1154(-)
MSSLKDREKKHVDKVKANLENYMKSQKYYEAHQLYRSLYNRYADKSQFEEAGNFALHGALAMFEHKQGNSAGDLSLQWLDSLSKGEKKVTTETIETIRKLFNLFPKDSQESRHTFIKAAISYTEKFGTCTQGDPVLHYDAAQLLYDQKDYGGAQGHFLRAGFKGGPAEAIDEHAKMLYEWSQKGLNSERDLFVARSVLQYLCLQNLKCANLILEKFLKLNGTIDSPLIHFIRFLLKTCERDAGPLFEMLRQKYSPSIERDSIFSSYLSKIGELYFGIKPASGGILGTVLDLAKNL